jgi:hypothetical protein
MKTALVNLSNKLFEESRFRLNSSATKHGVDKIFSYDIDDIKDTTFYKANSKILLQARGVGYWIWKPYIILETIKKLSDGDVVIYSDCGHEIINDIIPLARLCASESILLFANGDFRNSQWTKRDCFILMDADEPAYWFSPHCDASFALFCRTEKSLSFLNTWISFCCDERVSTDIHNELGKKNLPGFIEHRWDQSILSILAKKSNVILHRMPSQFGNHFKISNFRIKGEINCINQLYQKQLNFYSDTPYTNSPYHQLLDHHRSKNSSELSKRRSKLRQVLFSLKLRLKEALDWIHRIILCRYR